MPQESPSSAPASAVNVVPQHLKIKCHRCGNTLAYGILGPGSAIEIQCRHCKTPDGEKTKTMIVTPA